MKIQCSFGLLYCLVWKGCEFVRHCAGFVKQRCIWNCSCGKTKLHSFRCRYAVTRQQVLLATQQSHHQRPKSCTTITCYQAHRDMGVGHKGGISDVNNVAQQSNIETESNGGTIDRCNHWFVESCHCFEQTTCETHFAPAVFHVFMCTNESWNVATSRKCFASTSEDYRLY